MKNQLRHLCFSLIALASLTANYADAGDQLLFKGEMKGDMKGDMSRHIPFSIEVRENSITTDKGSFTYSKSPPIYAVKDGDFFDDNNRPFHMRYETHIARSGNVVILKYLVTTKDENYGNTDLSTECTYFTIDGGLMKMNKVMHRSFVECPTQAPKEAPNDYPNGWFVSNDDWNLGYSTRTDFSIGQPSPSQSKPGAASGSTTTAQKGTAEEQSKNNKASGGSTAKENSEGAYYVDNPNAEYLKQKRAKEMAEADAKALKERIETEKDLAAQEERRKKNVAQREEQAKQELSKQEQARLEAEEKQRLEDYWAKLQNPSYLQSASQGSPAQGQNTGLAQPSPAQQALDKEVDEKAPCGVKCMLVLPIKAAVQTVAVVGNFIRDFFKPGDHNNPPLGSSVCSAQSANFQECSNRLIAARGMFFGLGNLGNAEIIQRQGNEGIGGSQ